MSWSVRGKDAQHGGLITKGGASAGNWPAGGLYKDGSGGFRGFVVSRS